MNERLENFLRRAALEKGRSVYRPAKNSPTALRAFQDDFNTLEALERIGHLHIIGEPHRESRTGRDYIDMVTIEITTVGAKFLAAPSDEGNSMAETSTAPDPRNVFVVHGRNLEARGSMFRFLRSLGLRPIEWSQATMETGNALPFIGEVLDAAFSTAKAVVVLLTPDDEARLREQFRADDDPPYEAQLTGQARPNVLFEAGMALGRHPERTVIVELGKLRPFSDIAGRHTVRLSNDTRARQELAQRLATAGCAVDLTGRDWHSEGDFEIQSNTSQEETVRPTVQKIKLYPEYDEADIISFLADYLLKKHPKYERFLLSYEDVDRELNFAPGMAAVHMGTAAKEAGYEVISKGKATITLCRERPDSTVRLLRG
jgi:predicted nucleotide-binding protein